MSAESEQRREERHMAYLQIASCIFNKAWDDIPELRIQAYTVDKDKDIKDPIEDMLSYMGGYVEEIAAPYSFVLQDTIRDYRDVGHITKTRSQLMQDITELKDFDNSNKMFPYTKPADI